MNPTDYEKSLAEKLLYEFPPPLFEVVHDLRVEGIYSKGKRQIDVAVRRAGEHYPFLVAEAKLYSDTLDIGYIDAFVTKLKEVNAKIGVMVVSSGYSVPGERLAKAFGITLGIMTIDEALEMQWRPVARQIFPLDWAFHPDLAAGLYRIQEEESPQTVMDALEDIPFDEWVAFVNYALHHYPSEAADFLWFVALQHYDAGWRYNAVEQLSLSGTLDQSDVKLLLSRENDPEIIDLLRMQGRM